MSKGAPGCTAPAVVLTVLAVPGFTETRCTVALTIAAVCRAIINSSFVGITHTDILLSWLEMRGPWRSLASRSSLAPSHVSLVTTLRAMAHHFRRYRHDGGFRMLELQLNRLPHI